MNSFRRFSRRAWLLHGYLIASLILQPVPQANSYWTDSNNDGVKEEVANPPEGDSWWQQDSDTDGLTNAEEVLTPGWSSDPYTMDSDRDGLGDIVEYQYSQDALSAAQPLPYDPWNWSTNGSGYSDFDRFYQQLQGYTPVVNYNNLAAGSFFTYSDADGDGLKNFEDGDPLNMDRDGDGVLNWNDSGYMDDPNNGYVPPPESDPGVIIGGNWYPTGTLDSDGDGTPDQNDAFPYGSFWYGTQEYGGTWSDRDNDGVPDPADSFPDGSYWYNGIEYGGAWADQDGDGVPDSFDPWPTVAGSYWYNGSEYSGGWNDQDGDGVPDPADASPNGSYWWNGTEYYGAWVDQDGDGTPDAFDATPTGGSSYWYNGVEYVGEWMDQDNDGIPDAHDATPNGGYWYNGTEYAGIWSDVDNDGIPDPLDATPNGGYWYNGVEYTGAWSDVDGDGVPDVADYWMWDPWNGAPHFSYNGSEYPGSIDDDRDGDTIPDGADAWPDDAENNADNDDDGLSNYVENTQHGTDPDQPDSDNDGLTDYEELLTWHTNPLLEKTNSGQLYTDYYMVDQTDTDGDQIPDRIEQWYVQLGYAMGADTTEDALVDFDSDGYSNLQAYRNGWSFIAHFDQYDNDQDGILDVLEDAWSAAYPGMLSSSSFDDAVQDFDNDGLMNFEEITLGLNPGSAWSRSTSVHDLQEWAWLRNMTANPAWETQADADQNAVPDGLQAFVVALNAAPELVPLPQRVAGDDYDGDGMPDVWEYRHHLDLRVASDAQSNSDGDSLVNLLEYQQGRDPTVNDDPPPQITTTVLPDAAMETNYSATIEVVGNAPPFTFSIVGGLPDGLILNPNSGSISGTPSLAGTSTFMVQVTDQNSQSATQELSITVQPDTTPPLSLSGDVPEGKVGVEYTATFTASGGTGPYTYSMASGQAGLPAGLGLDSATGVLSGTPVTAGSHTLAVQATDSMFQSTTGTFSVTFTELEIVTETLPLGGVSGTPYSAVITARNGTVPYAFGVVEREGDSGLPAGYVLQGNGMLTFVGGVTLLPSGLLPTGGMYTFTVEVTDDAGQTAEKQLSLVLEAPPPPPPLTITTLSLPEGVAGTDYAPYEAVVGAANGVQPYQFSVGGAGLVVNMDGTLSGTLPAEPGTYTVSVSVQDHAEPPANASAALTLVVKPPPPPPLEIVGEYSASGGAGGYHWSVLWDEHESGKQPTATLQPAEGSQTVLTWTDSDDPDAETLHFTGHVVLTDSETAVASKPVTVSIRVAPMPDDPETGNSDENDRPTGPGQPTTEEDEFHEVNTTDGAGSRYRKVGLNGSPLSDGKPQAKDESGEVPEETYIDAYTGELRHGVSDVYASVDSSLLPLLVRRDCTDDTFYETTGTFAENFRRRMDRPFGAGWTTNLCATLKLESNGTRATVTDEQGASHSFDLVKVGLGSYWRASASATGDIKSRWNQLYYQGADPRFGGTFIYIKTFGTRCRYDYCVTKAGAGAQDLTQYFRLTQVTDRLENQLLYSYPGQQKLIPDRIYDPARPGREVNILQDTTHNRITEVAGPGGDVIRYSYTLMGGENGLADLPVLSAVTRVAPGGGTGTAVGYGYSLERDYPGSAAWHAAVNRITDELGRAYAFTYRSNELVKYVQIKDDIETVFVRGGQPRLVATVTLPDGGVTQIDIVREATIQRFMTGTPYSLTTVNSPAGQTLYHFTEPFVQFIDPPENVPAFYRDSTLSFTRMDITAAAGTETYTFSPAAGMALASAKDVSGNTTSFTYDTANLDDPIRETDALGNFKDFTYDPGTRVMSSMTDQTGVITEYTLQPLTGLKLAETVRGAGGVIERQSTFEYNDATFKGFMTKATVDASANDTAPPTVTTYEVGGLNGWLEVTETVQTAAGLASTVTVSNLAGGKASVTDPRGNLTLFSYDAHHRLTRVTHPGNSHKDLAYDAHGNLIRETNENNVRTFHEYDAMNRRVKTTVDLNDNGTANAGYTNASVNGSSVSYNGDIVSTTTYNLRGQVVTQTDARGKVTTHTYDPAGRLTATLDGNLLTSFDYSGPNSGGSVFDSSGFKPTQITAPRNVITTLTYDKMYRTTAQTVSAGGITATTSTLYDAAGRPTRVTDALGRHTLTVYDVFGQVQRVTHPDGTQVSTDYTHHGKPWKVVDEAGNLTQTEFDAAGRAVRTIAPPVNGVSAITQMQYDAAGNAVRVTDPLGRVTDTQYDERNRAVAAYAPPVWDALAGATVRPSTQTTYDALGQVLTVTDPQGNVTTKHYDRAGRNWLVEAPAVWSAQSSVRPTTVTKFDAGGLALSVTNPLGQTVTNTYNILGRLITTTDAFGITNTFVYDEAGNRTSVKDGLNQETTFVYDGFNRLKSQTFANGDTTTFTYNAVQKLSQTSPRGITTTYTYDNRDRVTATNAPGLTRQHQYDVSGRLLGVTEPANPTANVTYTYDELGRVLSETSRGITHTYSYDIVGNRVSASYGTGRMVTTTYDAFNRPMTINEGGRSTSYGYDLGGRAVILKAGNGQTSRNTYDELGRLKQRTLFRTEAMAAGDELAQFAWTHDLLGNVMSQSETWPGEVTRPGVRTTSMAYDANNRLTNETIDDPTVGVTATAYAYDNANNRSTKQVTGGTEPGVWSYAYNAANQLTNWEKLVANSPVKTAALTYDAAGNRIAQSVSENGNAQSTLYAWDAQDRLASVTMPDGAVHAYKYDYRTRRLSTTRSGGVSPPSSTAILFAGGLSLAEWDSASSTPSTANSPTVEYTRGPDMGGGVGGMLYSLRGGTTKYSLSNGRGDIVAQADQAATLTWTASYEAYGKRTKETGTNQDKQRANSKDEDPTGLLNEGFRYRDIETGVWLSRDPAGFVDGPNLYAYVKQNPWTAFDPDGLAEKKGYYPKKGERGVTRLEADEKGEPLTRTGANGKTEVLANHYTDWGDDKFSWFNGPQGKPNSSGWEPAGKYGITQPTSTARENFVKNERWNPQDHMSAWGDAANHPTVQAAGTAARWSIELSAMMMTGGLSRARAPLQVAANGPAKDVLLLGRGVPEVLRPIAQKVGARVIDTPLRGKELYKHIYGEMRKADSIIQVMDDIPKALAPGTGQWSRMEKELVKNVERIRSKTDQVSKAELGFK